MPRFHLNIVNGVNDAADEEGQDFPDLAAARAEAIRGIRSILASEIHEGAVQLGGRIEIADDASRIVETVAFEDAVTIRR